MRLNDFVFSIYPPAANALNSIVASLGTVTAVNGNPRLNVSGRTAIVPIDGVMFKNAGQAARALGVSGTRLAAREVLAANADDGVDNILLLIDSPGGSVDGLGELGDAVKSSTKTVIAQADGMIASAAYYVAAQADKIMVGRNDLVGSIGTRMLFYDYSEAFSQQGIKPVVIDTGKFKSAGAPGTEITEEQAADFQRIVDFYFADFKNSVTTGRGMNDAEFNSVADGRMLTPSEALEFNLIDGISTIDETLLSMRSNNSSNSTNTMTRRARLQL